MHSVTFNSHLKTSSVQNSHGGIALSEMFEFRRKRQQKSCLYETEIRDHEDESYPPFVFTTPQKELHLFFGAITAAGRFSLAKIMEEACDNESGDALLQFIGWNEKEGRETYESILVTRKNRKQFMFIPIGR